MLISRIGTSPFYNGHMTIPRRAHAATAQQEAAGSSSGEPASYKLSTQAQARAEVLLREYALG